jgi:hypothetical protein
MGGGATIIMKGQGMSGSPQSNAISTTITVNGAVAKLTGYDPLTEND